MTEALSGVFRQVSSLSKYGFVPGLYTAETRSGSAIRLILVSDGIRTDNSSESYPKAHNWTTINPPLAWTAVVTFFHASICSFE